LFEIILTREDANSDTALLVEWLAEDRAQVHKHQPICVVETSKSAIEIESPGEGTLVHLAREGEEVDLGSRIAAIAASAEELAELDGAQASEPATTSASAGPARATRKAVELAAEHGIDLDSIAKPGFITAEDVEALIEGAGAAAGSPAPSEESSLLRGVSLEGVSLPDSFALEEGAGALDPTFLEALRADPKAFGELSSEDRCEEYRSHGALIGDGVSLGERTVILAPRIVLGDGVEIGHDGEIRCEELFCVGTLTLFRPRLRVRCRRAYFGEGGYVSENVQIGGGGSGDPQAILVAGDLVFVGNEAFVNVCRPVVIGREVFLTMRSAILTHNVGHSVLEGFENRFAPVVLEDRAQIGIGTVVYAGCRVGRESIVGSNSYVVTDIPPGKLALGVPARVAGEAHREPSERRRSELAARMMDDLRELLELRGHDVTEVTGGFALEADGKPSQVLFVEALDPSYRVPEAAGETVVLTLRLQGDPPAGCSVLDLLGRRLHGSGGILLETTREFCRKRGIRFEPGPWRYGGGLI
jgi:acetyltransferase-like isoleucine patch superfamily enzyme